MTAKLAPSTPSTARHYPQDLLFLLLSGFASIGADYLDCYADTLAALDGLCDAAQFLVGQPGDGTKTPDSVARAESGFFGRTAGIDAHYFGEWRVRRFGSGEAGGR